MKKKMIIIDDCNDCPHFFHDAVRGLFKCDHNSLEYRKELKLNNAIPKWCPLEDAK